MAVTRRSFIRGTLAASVAAGATLPFASRAKKGPRDPDTEASGAGSEGSTSAGLDRQGRLFGYAPFTQPLYIPPVLRPSVLDPAPGGRAAAIGSRATSANISCSGRPSDLSISVRARSDGIGGASARRPARAWRMGSGIASSR